MEFQKEVIEKICEGLPQEKKMLIQAVIEENMEITVKLEKATKLHSTTVEEFEQERYCLKNKIEMMSNMEKHYTEEVSSLQEQLQTLKSSSAHSKQHEEEIAKLKLKIEDLTSQLENQHASEKELKDKLEQTEKVFTEYKEEHEQLTEQKSMMMSEDYLQLQSQVTTMEENTERLEAQLKESDNHVKALLNEKEALKRLILSQGEDMEQMRSEISSYTNALEKSREENMEYKVLLENIQMEKSEHGEKGNSLFGELDDRRVQAETKLVSMQSQVETATKQLTKEKQLHHRLKVQMTTLLQANSDTVSCERLDRSFATISQLKTEKAALLSKLKHLESSQKEMMGKLLELQQNSSEEGDQEYTQFLIAVVQTKEEEITQLKEEINQNDMKLLHKDDKVIEGNRKIFKLESELEKIRKQSLKQSLQIEELKMKYEPEIVDGSVKQGKTEKIPMKLEDDPNHDESTKFVLKESILPSSNRSHAILHKEDNLHDSSKADTKCESFYTTAVTSPEKCVLRQGKQVHIKEEVVMISSEGERENVAVKEQNENKKENFHAPKRTQVHHNVKKISSSNATNIDKSQCKQQ